VLLGSASKPRRCADRRTCRDEVKRVLPRATVQGEREYDAVLRDLRTQCFTRSAAEPERPLSDYLFQ